MVQILLPHSPDVSKLVTRGPTAARQLILGVPLLASKRHTVFNQTSFLCSSLMEQGQESEKKSPFCFGPQPQRFTSPLLLVQHQSHEVASETSQRHKCYRAFSDYSHPNVSVRDMLYKIDNRPKRSYERLRYDGK